MKKLLLSLLFSLAVCSPVFAGPALVAHTIAGSVASAAVTTSVVNMTGANLIIIGITMYNGAGGTSAPSDSTGSNTWTPLTEYGNITPNYFTTQLYYCSPCTTSSSQTFSASATNAFTYPVIAVAGFSGASSSSVFDQQNGNTNAGTATTIQPGSITPGGNGYIIVTMLDGGATTGGFSINSSFAISDSLAYSSGNYLATAMAYYFQPSAGAINPTWTFNSVAGQTASIASFKVPAPPAQKGDIIWFGSPL